jgi:GTP-binding protein YchF
MMVRCFDDPNVVHVAGSVDPMRDIDVIDLELVLADVDTADKRFKKAQTSAKSGAKEAKAELGLAERVFAHLSAGKPARSLSLSDDERKQVATFGLMTAKPVLYCCNVGETDLPEGNAWSNAVRARAEKEGAGVVILCGKVEAELAELPESDRGDLLASYGLKEPALATLARECYRLLGLRSYFTAGEKEIRAWTIRAGALAPEAAGVIHTDFEKGFIRAQVYSIEDLEKYGSEAGIKSAGKLRMEGKDYMVQDGDVMHFLFNV